MPNVVTHILLPMVLVDLVRHHILKKNHVNKFSTFFVLVAGLAGMLPDLDIPIGWITGFLFGNPWTKHGDYFHSILVVIPFLCLALLFYYGKFKIGKYNSYQVSLFFLMVSVGVFSHFLLDCFILGGYKEMIPFIGKSICTRLVPANSAMHMAGLDAILLVLWLAYEQKRHKIKDYI